MNFNLSGLKDLVQGFLHFVHQGLKKLITTLLSLLDYGNFGYKGWLNSPPFFADEPCRQRLLDLISDLALC
jgi:hypothetical protein